MRKFLCLFLMCLLTYSSQVLAVPVAVYGNTYDVNDPASAGNAADFNISTSIRSQIAASPSLLQVNPRVLCAGGIVTFVGQVQNIDQAIQLIQIAESTPGVINVVLNNLTDPSGNQIPADVVAVAKIKGLYMREKLSGNVDVTATSVVVLTGTVDTQEQADQAVALAQSVGNVSVKSEIKVRSK